MGVDILVCKICYEGYFHIGRCFLCEEHVCDSCTKTLCVVCPCEHENFDDVDNDKAGELCDDDGCFDPELVETLWKKRCVCKGCKCSNHKCVLFEACTACANGKIPEDEEIVARMFLSSDKTLDEVAEFMDVQPEPIRRALMEKPFSCPLERKCVECKSVLEYDEPHATPQALRSVELKATQLACEPCVTLRGISQGAPILPQDVANVVYDYLAPSTVSQKRKRACKGCKQKKKRKIGLHTCQASSTLIQPR